MKPITPKDTYKYIKSALLGTKERTITTVLVLTLCTLLDLTIEKTATIYAMIAVFNLAMIPIILLQIKILKNK